MVADISMSVHYKGRDFTDFSVAAHAIEQDLEDALDRASGRVSEELIKAFATLFEAMATKHGGSWNGRMPTGVDHLFSRSGGSLRAMKDSIKVDHHGNLTMEGQIAAPFPLSFHEFGGTIKASKSKYLTIPLPAAMDGRGVPLKPSARDWPNTFVARSKRGNLLIFQRRGRDIVPLYLLKTSVYQPPRLEMTAAFEDVLPWFERRAFEAISQELDR